MSPSPITKDPASKKAITIVGGGIIGLATAYFACRQGHVVSVIEQHRQGESCASRNAGYVTPSHFIPLAAPGMVKKGLKWMLNPESPFYIRPKLDPELFSWLWKFNRHCNASHVQRVKQTLYQLCVVSKQLHLEIAEEIGEPESLNQKGIYVVTQSNKVLAEEIEIVTQARQLGLNAQEVSKQTLQTIFADLSLDIKGGIYFPEDAHLEPQRLLNNLHKYLQAQGVEFLHETEVNRFEVSKGRVTSIGLFDQQTGISHNKTVEELVLTSGSWSSKLAKLLQVKLPLQAGKGYSITIDNPWQVDTPLILSEAAVAITPLDHRIRFAGTMEFSGIDDSINLRRVQGILKSVGRFATSFDPNGVDLNKVVEQKIAWSGLRPCSPDGLPFIGRLPHYENVTLGAGHAMLGLTLAPVTGALIAAIISEGGTEPNMHQNELANYYQQWRTHLAVDRFS